MTTRKTSTGHTLTIDATRMLLSIAGPTETMDGIPDAEIHAACAEAGVEWQGEVVDETTYRVHEREGAGLTTANDLRDRVAELVGDESVTLDEVKRAMWSLPYGGRYERLTRSQVRAIAQEVRS